MPLADDLISYWALDEASGNALDSHGTNELTEASGTIEAASGKVGGARDLEAADTEFFALADNDSVSFGDEPFTLQAWVNLETQGFNWVFQKYDGVASCEYQLQYNVVSGGMTFRVSPDGLDASAVEVVTAALSTGTWYLVHAWHDPVANEIGISVNAGAPVTASHSGGVFDGSALFRLGFIYDGLVDEAAIWGRVLTSDDRTNLYNGGLGLAYPLTVSPSSARGNLVVRARPRIGRVGRVR